MQGEEEKPLTPGIIRRHRDWLLPLAILCFAGGVAAVYMGMHTAKRDCEARGGTWQHTTWRHGIRCAPPAEQPPPRSR